mgnify:CR=1 FL=1
MHLIEFLKRTFSFGKGVVLGMPADTEQRDPVEFFGEWFKAADEAGRITRLVVRRARRRGNGLQRPAVMMHGLSGPSPFGQHDGQVRVGLGQARIDLLGPLVQIARRRDAPLEEAQLLGRHIGKQHPVDACGTGIGVSIAANQIDGIRAALVHDPWTAALAAAGQA